MHPRQGRGAEPRAAAGCDYTTMRSDLEHGGQDEASAIRWAEDSFHAARNDLGQASHPPCQADNGRGVAGGRPAAPAIKPRLSFPRIVLRGCGGVLYAAQRTGSPPQSPSEADNGRGVAGGRPAAPAIKPRLSFPRIVSRGCGGVPYAAHRTGNPPQSPCGGQ